MDIFSYIPVGKSNFAFNVYNEYAISYCKKLNISIGKFVVVDKVKYLVTGIKYSFLTKSIYIQSNDIYIQINKICG